MGWQQLQHIHTAAAPNCLPHAIWPVSSLVVRPALTELQAGQSLAAVMARTLPLKVSAAHWEAVLPV